MITINLSPLLKTTELETRIALVLAHYQCAVLLLNDSSFVTSLSTERVGGIEPP
jgi:hypothetical protein